jgi:hypothetical protein
MSEPCMQTRPLNLVGKLTVVFLVSCGITPSLLSMNRLAIRVIQQPTSSHVVYLDPKGKLIDRVNIPSANSAHISLRDDTIKCTDWKANTMTIHVEIGSITMIANIYRVCNDVCNDVYKYDFMFVVNCNSYNVFSCV